MQLAGQLIRYGIVGVIASAIYSAVYFPLATYAFPAKWAVAAVPPAFFVAVAFGFVSHRRWSFDVPGDEQAGHRQWLKFATVQCGGLVLNSAFTWLVTVPGHYPAWVALIPCLSITPLVTFGIHRSWVFR